MHTARAVLRTLAPMLEFQVECNCPLGLDSCTTLKLTAARTRRAMISAKKQMNAGLYRVEGPAKLRVESGSFYALGRVYGQGNELVVPRGLVVCLKVEAPCVVEITGGTMTEAKPEEEVVDQWKVLAETLAEPGRILVVGETDRRKKQRFPRSSLTRLYRRG